MVANEIPKTSDERTRGDVDVPYNIERHTIKCDNHHKESKVGDQLAKVCVVI